MKPFIKLAANMKRKMNITNTTKIAIISSNLLFSDIPGWF
jgi:hypothetical protein